MKAAGQRDKSGRFRLSPAFILVPNRIPNCTAEREKSRRRGAVPSRLPRPFQRPAPEGQREKLIYLHPRLPPAAGGLAVRGLGPRQGDRSEEHTSELQSLMRISYAVFCLKKKQT